MSIRAAVMIGLAVVAATFAGAARADGPATSWTSSTAGQQTLDVYRSATSLQKAPVIYTTQPVTMPMPNGNPLNSYTDFSSTGSSAAEFEANAGEVLTRAKIIGRFLPGLRLLGTIGLAYTAFDLGWRFSTGQSFWSDVFGDSSSLRFDETGTFPLMSATAWKYRSSGPGYGFTSPGWYLAMTVQSNTSYCQGNAGAINYFIPNGTSLGVNGSDCMRRSYYSTAQLLAQHPQIASMGTVLTLPYAPGNSSCPLMYYSGGTWGATSCSVIYRSETDMLSRLKVAPPVLWANQTAPNGTTNTGTYTVPSGQGSESDVAASDGFIIPAGATWDSLTPQQKAAVAVLALRLNPNFAPIADQQTMPNCVGVGQAICDAALDSIAATGTRTYTVAGVDDADLSKPAGAIITQPIFPGASFDRTASLGFSKNPDPLPVVWSAPSWDETYDQYVTRLRNLGWLGQATAVDLGPDNGEGDFITGGVPCTNVPTGSRIDANAGATLYKNPSSFSGLDPSSGVVCGGPAVTGRDIDTCAFPNDDIYSWRDAMNTNPFFYTTACSEAWSLVRSLFPADGSIDPSDASLFKRMMIPGANIKDADVIAYLTRNGQPMTDFEKWATDTLDPNGPRPFQVHFYWNKVTERVEYVAGFKVKFNQIFYP